MVQPDVINFTLQPRRTTKLNIDFLYQIIIKYSMLQISLIFIQFSHFE